MVKKSPKRNLLKQNLSNSLRQEEKKLDERFKKAEELFSHQQPQTPPANIQTEPKLPSVKKPAEKPVAKEKAVYQTFTMREQDITLLDSLTIRAAREGVIISKSEIVRAGLLALEKSGDKAFVQSVNQVERLKRGRPGN